MTRQVSSRLALCGVGIVTLFAALVGYGLAAPTEGTSPPFVAIKRGVAGPYKWQVLTRREASSLASKYRPCLGVGFSGKNDPGAPVNVFYVCRAVKPTPNIVVYSAGSGKTLRTVIAVAYDRQIRRVLIDLGSRGLRHRRLTLLSKKLARKVDLAPYRYSALQLAGHFCIHRVIGLDGAGEVATEDQHVTCF